jgi:hypothetical protein
MTPMRTTPTAVAPPLAGLPVNTRYVKRARLLIGPAPLP